MKNQIRQKEDGSFEIGVWLLSDDNKVTFMEVAEADTLKEAVELADSYDDLDFKQAKFEIDRIGGIDAANSILDRLNKTNSVAAVFSEKDNFDIDQLRYVDQNTFEAWMEKNTNLPWKSSEHYVDKWDIQRNLKTIRFLTY